MKDKLIIGRSSQCDIIIPDERVSRQHAEITIVNGQYVFRDTSSNGSTFNGEYVSNRAVAVAPGSDIRLSNCVPLPWGQVYTLLPLKGVRMGNESETRHHAPTPAYNNNNSSSYSSSDEDRAGFGWCLLALVFPVVGFILYFVWRDRLPHRARTVAIMAWIGLGINVTTTFLSIASMM